MINTTFRKISEILESNYRVGKLNAVAAGALAFVGHPFYWFLWSYIFPHHQESIFFRFSSSALGLLLVFSSKWPDKLKKFLPIYWLFFMIWILPVTFTYLGLKNNFTDVWIICEVMSVFFLVLFSYTWRLALFSIIVGFLFGSLFFFASNDLSLFIVQQRNIEAAITMSFVVITGILFSHFGRIGISGYIKQEQEKDVLIQLETEKSKALKSLAGSIAHEIRNPLNSINLVKNEIHHLLDSDTILHNPEQLKTDLKQLNAHVSDAIDNANNIINLILADLSEKSIEPSEFSYLKPEEVLPEIIRKYGYRSEAEKTKVYLEFHFNSDGSSNLNQNTNSNLNNISNTSSLNSSSFIFRAVASRFEFIIYNLMKNALYYLAQYPDSKIVIGAEIREISGQSYNVIYVQDSGPGIPEEIIDKLFEDFFTSGKKDGTGLGLAFCKRNMLLFGGDIICESRVGSEEEIIENGIKKTVKKPGLTKFSLLFPVLSESQLLEASSLFAAKEAQNSLSLKTVGTSTEMNNYTNTISNMSNCNANPKTKKILIVDDEKVNLMVTKAKLERFLSNQYFKIQCDIALGGEKAIEMFKVSFDKAKDNKNGINSDNSNIDNFLTKNYDLVLMDIQMPGLCGMETTRKLREFIAQQTNSNLKEFPIIAHSSLDYKSFSEQAKKADAKFTGYINKSSDNNIVCRTVSKWLFDYRDEFLYLGTEEEISKNLKNVLTNKGILLADDQETNRKITKKSLERYGAKITEAKNGEELIGLYQESLIDNKNQNNSQTKISKFNIIITDINMPIISGDEASLKIREIEQNHFTKYQNRIPIIALSGDGEPKDIIKYFESEITDYFIKGSDPNLLIKIIANYIKDDEARKEAVCEDDLNIKTDAAKDNSSNMNNSSNTIFANQNTKSSNQQQDNQVATPAQNSSTLFNRISNQTNSSNLIIFNSSKIDFFEPEEKTEIINHYLADSATTINKIKEYQQEGNLVKTSLAVHALKGVTSNIGGEKLVAFIRDIEISLKKNQSPENENWIEDMKKLQDELVEELKRACVLI